MFIFCYNRTIPKQGLDVNKLINTLKLRAAIIEAGYTQQTLAEKLKMSPNTLSFKITGKSNFDIEEATRICDLLGIKDGAQKAAIFLQ